MSLAVRVAAGQLASLRRHRRAVPAGPLVGLLHDNPSSRLSVVLAASPGERADPMAVTAGLSTVRTAFAAAGKSAQIELVDEANPGLADALVEHGASITIRLELLALAPVDLIVPEPGPDTVARVVRTQDEHDEAVSIASTVFSADLPRTPLAESAADGGKVLVWWRGVPVATATWTAIGDGVTEIVAVATLAEHRCRGLGSLATAYATRAAIELGGASLPWLSTATSGAARIYQKLGFRPAATAVLLDAGVDQRADRS